jgi:hypothetical protein
LCSRSEKPRKTHSAEERPARQDSIHDEVGRLSSPLNAL